MRPSEAQTQRQILDWLKLNGIFAWRNNTGAMAGSHKGKRWFVRFGCPGMSDILGIYKAGKFLAIEVKRSDGRLTQDQQCFLESVKANGGIAIVARSLKDVQEILG